jgi:hypothetical protein
MLVVPAELAASDFYETDRAAVLSNRSGRIVVPHSSIIETMHRAPAELIESGAARCAKKAGDVAPFFSLRD